MSTAATNILATCGRLSIYSAHGVRHGVQHPFFWHLVVDCVQDLGATTLSITHDLASARKIGDRIAMIYQGQIIWSGLFADVDESDSDFVDQFTHGRADGPIKMRVLNP